MLQARCSLSVCPVYMCHKYVNMDANSAFLKLTNAMACVKIILNVKQKSCIRETKHLSTDADSSTDAIEGWTKNTPKTIFFEKWEKSSKAQKLQKV